MPWVGRSGSTVLFAPYGLRTLRSLVRAPPAGLLAPPGHALLTRLVAAAWQPSRAPVVRAIVAPAPHRLPPDPAVFTCILCSSSACSGLGLGLGLPDRGPGSRAVHVILPVIYIVYIVRCRPLSSSVLPVVILSFDNKAPLFRSYVYRPRSVLAHPLSTSRASSSSPNGPVITNSHFDRGSSSIQM